MFLPVLAWLFFFSGNNLTQCPQFFSKLLIVTIRSVLTYFPLQSIRHKLCPVLAHSFAVKSIESWTSYCCKIWWIIFQCLESMKCKNNNINNNNKKLVLINYFFFTFSFLWADLLQKTSAYPCWHTEMPFLESLPRSRHSCSWFVLTTEAGAQVCRQGEH